MFTEEQVQNFSNGIKTLMATTKIMYDTAKEVGFDDTQAFVMANEYFTKTLEESTVKTEDKHE